MVGTPNFSFAFVEKSVKKSVRLKAVKSGFYQNDA
jgi:hypothetical protein